MGQQRLLQLAQQLERLGAEECFYNQQSAGPAMQAFLDKQQEVLITAEKLQRELTGEVRYNPARLMGIKFSIEEELETISGLVTGIEDIKLSAVDSVEDLPAKTEKLSRMLKGYFFRAVLV